MLFPTLISLGLWQLDRADEKREIEKSVNAASQKSPLLLNDLGDIDVKGEVYRPAEMTGRFDSDRQYLWDNKTHQGRPGYHVLTPFLLDSGNAVMVNRGWVPMLGRRDQLPDVAVDKIKMTISGVIKNPSNAIQLAERLNQKGKAYPHVFQAFETDVFASELGIKLLPVMIELATDEQHGYIRDWKPYFGKIEKHKGYALQWFIMSLIALFFYIKLNTKRVVLSQATL
ncbi:MAG: SURF1 family protein [Leucothrix sp.]